MLVGQPYFVDFLAVIYGVGEKRIEQKQSANFAIPISGVRMVYLAENILMLN